MAPETKTPPTSTSSGAAATGSPAGALTRSALDDGRGTTTIADSVVTKVAGIAAREVAGVYALGGSGARAIGNVSQRVGFGEARGQGVSVEVDERTASVELTVVIEYGESIPRITQDIRDQVVKRVEGICGLNVTAVDIAVDDLHFVGDDDTGDQRS